MSEHVEEIRKAAALMRERAGKASFGPWWAASDGLVWADRPGDPVSGSEQVEDAQHIASWHPTVALAVADWLERVAYAIEIDDPDDLLGLGEPTAARRVAGAYLGEAERA